MHETTTKRTKVAKPVDVGGGLAVPEVGDVVTLDGRSVSDALMEGDDFFDSGYPGCDFRLPAPAPVHSVAVNVRITGRSWQWKDGASRVRCQVEFVGDCEPSTFRGAWLMKRPVGRPG